MRKILLLTLSFILIFAISSCNKEQADEDVIKQPHKDNKSYIDLKQPEQESHSSVNDNYVSYPIIYNEILLGGYSNGDWQDASEIYLKLNGGEKYKIYTFSGFIGEGVVNKFKSEEIENSDFININIDFKTENIIGEYVAINCNWDAMPRIPSLQSNDSETYKKIVREILQNNGIEDNIPINIRQNLKVDLEGDGIDEVIIMAENVSPVSGYLKNNSYSILFVRKIINNEVKNIFIAKDIVVTDKDYIDSVALTYSIKSIIDADGDNVLELLVESAYYEGLGYSLYKIEDKDVKLLLSCVSGL